MQVNGQRVLPARRAGLIIGESMPPISGGIYKPVNKKKLTEIQKQRVDDQEVLVLRILKEESELSLTYEGELLAKKSWAYKQCALTMMDCSNVLLPGLMGAEVKADLNSDQTGSYNRYVGGVCHCSKAICPLCLPYQDGLRREKLELVAKDVIKLPLKHYLVTMTIRHHYAPNGNWGVLVDALRDSWRAMGKSRFFREAIKNNEVEGGFFRKLETTFTYENGQHPHFHILLSLRESVEPVAFFAKVKGYWEKRLREQGRSCEWQEGWWQSLKTSEDISKTLKYLTSGITEVTGASTKKSAPWHLPVEAFVEIFHSMAHLKWFSSGGCWRKKAVVEAESEANLEAERKSEFTTIYVIPGVVWNGWSFAQKVEARRLIGTKVLTHAECIDLLDILVNEALE